MGEQRAAAINPGGSDPRASQAYSNLDEYINEMQESLTLLGRFNE